MSGAALFLAAALGVAPAAAPQPPLRPGPIAAHQPAMRSVEDVEPSARATQPPLPAPPDGPQPHRLPLFASSPEPPARPQRPERIAPMAERAPSPPPRPTSRPREDQARRTKRHEAQAPVPLLAGDARAQPILCRDLRLEGHELDPIHHETLPCGIAAPVRLERVDGVHLRPPARLTCGTARTLANWVSGVLRPASEAELGARPTHLRVVGSYACRTRNHQPGARISEHGFGRAIDIAGLTLSDGRSVSVATDWGNGPEGRLLARMHAGACGPFKTVLGPGSDAYHDDHFHFDTAARSGAAYCR